MAGGKSPSKCLVFILQYLCVTVLIISSFVYCNLSISDWQKVASLAADAYVDLLPELQQKTDWSYEGINKDTASSTMHHELTPHHSLFEIEDHGKKNRNGAVRFPSKPKMALLAPLNMALFAPPNSDSTVAESNARSSMLTSETMVALDFIESSLSTIVHQTNVNRESGRIHGNYLYSLPNPPPKTEKSALYDLLDDFIALRDESLALVSEMDKVQFARIDESVSADVIALGREVVLRRRDSIVARCQALRDEIVHSAVMFESLIDLAEDFAFAPDGPTCKLDGIQPGRGRVEWGRASKSLGDMEESRRIAAHYSIPLDSQNAFLFTVLLLLNFINGGVRWGLVCVCVCVYFYFIFIFNALSLCLSFSVIATYSLATPFEYS